MGKNSIGSIELSVIVPAFRAVKLLESTVGLLKSELNKLNVKYEIIICEDGNKDGTDVVAARLAKEDLNVIHVHESKRLGRGRALNKGIHIARGKYVMYTDVDLEISPKYIYNFLDGLKKNAYDIVAASSRHPKSKVKSPFLRTVLSKTYNFLVRMLLKSEIYGHQGGMKAFRTEVIKDIILQVKDNSWFWDTEVLVLAQHKGFKIKELPIFGRYGFDESTVNSFWDAFEMFISIFKLRKRMIDKKHFRSGKRIERE